MQRAIMNRRLFALGLGSLIAGLPGDGSAQWQRARRGWAPWTKVPSIAVMSIVHDSRLPAVDKAVEFWNDTLAGLGSSFRLGSITHVPEIVPYEHVRAYAQRGANEFEINWTSAAFEFPTRIGKMSDNVIVVLTTSRNPSFAAYDQSSRKVLAVIGGNHFNSWKEVTNVVAHELGHVIGLGHNDDPNALMCGDVGFMPRCALAAAPKNSDFMPLTENDKRTLLEMYPAYWPEEVPPQPWKGDPPVIPNVRFGVRLRSGN